MKTTTRLFALTTFALLLVCALASGQATETVLYSFGAYVGDGTNPSGGLLLDSVGNIYGVTNDGGKNCFSNFGCGAAYKLELTAAGVWSETILHNFCSTGNPSTCPDGAYPSAGLIMDGNGNLYGTTSAGGTGAGVVFRLSPPSVRDGSWTETVLWTFSLDLGNGRGSGYGKLNMDAAGNLYGTTPGGGSHLFGTVYELSPQLDGTYSFSILHSFSGSDGVSPQYGVTFDSAGNIYGTTEEGGRGKSICNHGCGVVYKLSPSGGTWEETVLFEFDGIVGAYPISPISIDKSGNLYGTFEIGGGGNCPLFPSTCGGVFKLVPGSSRKYAFYFNDNGGPNGGNPQNGVTIGIGNTLYGTTGVADGGQVYMLQGSQETVLYNFCSLSSCTDGSVPSPGNVVIRGGGLYGSTVQGGDYGLGVVYRIQK
jgi:uncharacterized repeat protein (TIGR03803 family)